MSFPEGLVASNALEVPVPVRLALVVTCLNDAATVFEALESVLSQRRLPEQLGVVVGRSRDGTGDLLTFYEEEFDFQVPVASPEARTRGRETLRTAALSHLSADWVLFLPAHVYLYPHALEEARGSLEEGVACAAGGLTLFGADGEETRWGPPPGFTREELMAFGPVSPASVFWRVEILRELVAAKPDPRWGPFTILGRLLQADLQGHAGRGLDTRLGERMDPLEAAFCWTPSAREGLENLADWWEGEAGIEAPVLDDWRTRARKHLTEGFRGEPDRADRRTGHIDGWRPGSVGRTE